MQTLRRAGYREQRVRRRHPAETMAMECILCFAVMEKLKTGAPGNGVRTAGRDGKQILHEEVEER